MQPTDIFLFWVALIAATRGRPLVVTVKAADELFDGWLCDLAGVPLSRCKNGLLTTAEAKRILAAGRFLQGVPIYVQRTSNDFSLV